MSASGAMPRLMGMRSADTRRAEMPPPTAATHATNRPPTTPPGLRGRNSWRGWGRSFRWSARGAAATSGSSRYTQAGASDQTTAGRSRPTSNRRFASGRRPGWLRPAYSGASASLSRPWPAHRLGRARPGPRPGDFSGVTRRAARHRHPQPLTAFHATVRTAREKSGFKAGLRRGEKSGLERG